MKKIEKVLICGLGAIGTIYADKLNNNCTLKILADDERIERYKKEPIIYNGKTCHFDFISPEKRDFKADLIVIATKNSGFVEAIECIKNFIGDETIILSLLNGISSEETLIKEYGKDKVLYSYYVGHTSSRTANIVTFDGEGEIVFGNLDNKEHCAKVKAVKELFEKAEINYSIPQDMEYAIWKKFLVNVGTNQASAVLRGNYRLFQNSKTALDIAKNLMKEAQAIAQAKGVKNAEGMLDESLAIIMSMLPETKSSMLQDVEAGRKTEVEIFAGKVIEMGKKHNIPTPYNEIFFQLINALNDSPT